MALREYVTAALGDHKLTELVCAGLAAESLTLPDLPLLREEHLARVCPELKMGPRLRLLRHIESHPPGSAAHPSPESVGAGATAAQESRSGADGAHTTVTASSATASATQARVRSRRVSKSLLRAEQLTSVQFMKVWTAAAGEGADRLEGPAATAFLDAMLTARAEHPLSPEELADGRAVVLEGFGSPDGALEIGSLQQLLSVEECFLMGFRSKSNITSVAFMRIFTHYDEDGDGTIAQAELQGLLRDLLTRDRADAASATAELSASSDVLPSEIAEYTEVLLEMFDTNHDGKISIAELSRMLSTEQSYLDVLKDKAALTKKEFRKIFRHFDRDKNGAIAGPELLALAWDELRSEGGVDLDAIGMEHIKARAAAMLELAGSTDGTILPGQLAAMLGLDPALAE